MQRIQEEIVSNLEGIDAKRYLEKLCNGRLQPTPWLNKVCPPQGTPGCIFLSVQDCREPLYLKDTPVIVEDTRSDEQRNFPEFFQHLLPHS